VKAFVLDASLAMEWFSKDPSPEALTKRSLFDDRVAVVPALWRYEVMNVITRWQRQREITPAEAALMLSDALQLPFAIVEEGSPDAVVEAAHVHGLSANDATYLRAAMVTGEPLATLDQSLIRAAAAVGVECV
jgi:predicted nucleic acid-binding protein